MKECADDIAMPWHENDARLGRRMWLCSGERVQSLLEAGLPLSARVEQNSRAGPGPGELSRLDQRCGASEGNMTQQRLSDHEALSFGVKRGSAIFGKI